MGCSVPHFLCHVQVLRAPDDSLADADADVDLSVVSVTPRLDILLDAPKRRASMAVEVEALLPAFAVGKPLYCWAARRIFPVYSFGINRTPKVRFVSNTSFDGWYIEMGLPQVVSGTGRQQQNRAYALLLTNQVNNSE